MSAGRGTDKVAGSFRPGKEVNRMLTVGGAIVGQFRGLVKGLSNLRHGLYVNRVVPQVQKLNMKMNQKIWKARLESG